MLVALVSFYCSAATEDPSTVLILVNDQAPPEAGTGSVGASVYVGQYYAQQRGIPAQNIVHLNIPLGSPPNTQFYDSEIVPFSVFDATIRQPVKAFLENNALKNRIKYIVPTYGVPNAILTGPVALNPPLPEGFPTSGFSVDSYLASLYSGTDDIYLTNPYALSNSAYSREHFRSWTNPYGWPMYLVTRLDGPSAVIAAGLVDKALQAEASLSFSSGTGYFDWRHQDSDTTDQTMKRAYDLAVQRGFPATLNDQSVTGALIQNAPNTLWAWGWYSGPTTCSCYSFVNGAVGAQLTSYTANRIRVSAPGAWVPLWLSAGITATWGATTEPYTSGYANGDNLLNHFWMGYNFAESAYLAAPVLNWAMVFIGDPLYWPPLFNSAITPQNIPRVSLSGNKTGQFYAGNLVASISLPSSPGVAGVQFLFDGYTAGPEILSAPYAVTFVTDRTWNGPLNLTAKIRYTSGSILISDPVAFLVNNPEDTQVAAPTFSPPGGTYTGSVAVTLSTATSGATIRYTLDGSSPTTSSPIASGPITLTASGWLRAVAFKSGVTPSPGVEYFYTIVAGGGGGQVATPTFSPAGGTYSGSVSVTISTATSGATIYYTLDGSTPTTSSPIASGPITLTVSSWLRAIAFKTGLTASSGVEYFYTITGGGGGGQVATPTFSPAGSYGGSVSVTISTATSGATIYYTLDGSTPTTSSPIASGPVTLTASSWLRANAFKTGMTTSFGVEYFYTITGGGSGGGQVATPTFNPAGGSYSGSVSVTISTATSGATIHYTLDGSTPTTSSATASGPVTLTASSWLRSNAFKTGMTTSFGVESFYSIF